MKKHSGQPQLFKAIGAIIFVGLITTCFTGSAMATPMGEPLRNLVQQRGLLIGWASGWKFTEDPMQTNTAKVEFNILTPDNDMKWICIHPERNRYDFSANNSQCSPANKHVEFAETNNMKVHGHTLVWHEALPQWVLNVPAGELETVMLEHINKVVGNYSGRVYLWDVVNEAIDGASYRNTIWYQAMGVSFIRKAFQRAHETDPNAVLLYNDYGIETINPKSNFLYQEIQRWRNEGTPIDAVGFQMHIGTDFNAFQSFADNMQRFANLGLDIYITEMDVVMDNTPQYQQQAEVYRQIVTQCLAQPRCKGIQTWGLTDKYTWLNGFYNRANTNPLLFNECYQPKPAYYAVQEALGGQHGRYLMLQAEGHNGQSGVETYDEIIAYVDSGDWIKFDNVDLGSGFTTLKPCYAKGGATNTSLEVRLDSLAGPVIATFATTSTGDWNNFVEFSTPITGGTGVHTLYFVFKGDSGVGNFDDFVLEGNSIPPTTSTPTPTLTPTPTPVVNLTLQAEQHNGQQGVDTYPTIIGYVDNGDWIKFDNVNLDGGYTSLRVRYAKGNTTSTWVELHLDSLTGTRIAKLTTKNTGSWDTYTEGTTTLIPTTGVHTLYFVFKGGAGVGNFDWFQFRRGINVSPNGQAEADGEPVDLNETETSQQVFLPIINR